MSLYRNINKSITEFPESWNIHPLSSEGSLSPYQLFLEGVNYAGSDTPDSGSNAAITLVEDRDHVSVSRMKFTQCSSLIKLISTVDPLASCVDNGLVLYHRVILWANT